jgi:hypothetical protein
MSDPLPWVFKVASEPWEFEAVYRLKYRTFVEEIPQHSVNPERILSDDLLANSACYVCVAGHRLLGMVAISGERPFSLDAKVPDLDGYLPPHDRPCEIRLLAVEPPHRQGPVFGGLLACLIRHAQRERFDLAVISATDRQEHLYHHLGFMPFGPPLGTPEARYQGMYITWDRLVASTNLLEQESAGDGGSLPS